MDKVEANRGDTVILPVRVESLSRIDGVTFAIR